MSFPFKVAVRFLKSNKLQTFFIVLGIAIGVSVQVFIGTLIDGLQKGLIDKTINNSPQITVSSNKDDKTIEDWEKKIIQIRESDSRVKNVSTVLDASAFIKDGTKSYPILMRGFQLEDSNKIYNIKNRIYESIWILQRDVESSRKKILIGRELKKKPGEVVKITTPTGKTEEFIISGFYDLEVSSVNKSWVITDLNTVQNTFGFENKITLENRNITGLGNENIIELKNINKIYGKVMKTQVLFDINVAFKEKSFNSIIGESGSGKSTMLNIMGTLDKPTNGEVYIDGQRTDLMTTDELAETRNQKIGFIFQFHYLLPDFTALENVLIPYMIKNVKPTKEVKERALINNPRIILADEPTGKLDSQSTENVYGIMREMNEKFQTTFIIITHDKRIAERTDRILEISDGKIVSDKNN